MIMQPVFALRFIENVVYFIQRAEWSGFHAGYGLDISGWKKRMKFNSTVRNNRLQTAKTNENGRNQDVS